MKLIVLLLNVKKFVLLSFLGIAVSGFALFEVNVFDFHHLFGRCEGSDYCRICTNCSRCGYCKGGGTCGVCYTPRPVIRRSATPRSYRSERSVSSKSAHSFDSRTPSVKRYYLPKSPTKKYSSTKVSSSFDKSETDSFSTAGQIESNPKSVKSLTNQTESSKHPEPIYSVTSTPDTKESFTIDIPENAEFVRVTASSANLREEFNTKSRIIQTLGHGDLLLKLKSFKGWVKVQTLDSGEIGYVFGGLLE